MISDNLEIYMKRIFLPRAKRQPLEHFRLFGSLTVTQAASGRTPPVGFPNIPRGRACVCVKMQYSLPRSNGHMSNKVYRNTEGTPNPPLAQKLPENN